MEFDELFRPFGLTLRPVPDEAGEAPETGSTFEENAIQKALYYGRQVDGWVIADDSGICVDVLGGAPGVHSARFAGTHGDDAANNRKLLEQLRGVPEPARGAKFVCALAVWRNDGRDVLVVRGEVAGRVTTSIRGGAGFGYDPLFYLPAVDKTFAELSQAEKNQISHRARAVSRLMEVWEGL